MANYSAILKQAYQQFILNIKGKQVPIPYRINIPAEEHPARQGKSDPETILKQLYEDAGEQGFNLKSASIEEIQEFMRKNKLGLDCSGFVYRMLDLLVQQVKGKPLTELGFDHVGRTNVATLTGDEHSITIEPSDIQPGDLIRIDSEAADGLNHCLLVMENKNGMITYAHSSRKTKVNGVHQDQIKNGAFPKDLDVFSYNPNNKKDGIRRLKVLK